MCRRVVLFAAAWSCVGCSNLLGLSSPHEAIDAPGGADAAIDAATPDFQLAVATIHPRVPAGGSDVLSIAVTRVGGFADDITVSVLSPPAGLSVGSAVTVSGSATTADLELAGSGSLAIGAHLPITVLGLAGSIDHQLPVDLPVTGLPGHLDPTYGTAHDGTVVFNPLGATATSCEDLDVDPTGLVTYAGGTVGGGAAHAIVGQLNVDGSFNGGFAHASVFGTGVEEVGPAGTNSVPSLAQAIARNVDRPIVSGAVDVSGADTAWIAAFNGIGDPDNAFGTAGQVFPGQVQIQNLVTAGDGGLLFASLGSSGTQLVQVTASGAVDATFNGGAPVVADLTLQAHQLVVDPGDPQHGFYIAGIAKTSQHARVERFLASGAPDTSFGSNGVAEGPVVVSNARLTVQPDGRPVVAGTANFKDVVTRFLRSGVPDPGFGANGTFTGTSNAGPIDVAVQADGKILVVGTNSSPAGTNIFRLTTAGALDATYGSAGDVSLGGPELFALMLGSDDTAFVCGISGTSVFVARITR